MIVPNQLGVFVVRVHSLRVRNELLQQCPEKVLPLVLLIHSRDERIFT